MTALRRLWHRHPLLVSGFVLSVAALLFFLLWLVQSPPPRHLEGPPPPIAGWMTPKFILHNYDLAPETLGEVLDLEPGARPRQTLDQIAQSRGMPVAVLIGLLEAAIAAAAPPPDQAAP